MHPHKLLEPYTYQKPVQNHKPVHSKFQPINNRPRPIPVYAKPTLSLYGPVPTYARPAPLPSFADLGAKDEPAEVSDQVDDVENLKQNTETDKDKKPEKLIIAPKKVLQTKEELMKIAVERLKELEKLKEEGLLSLNPN